MLFPISGVEVSPVIPPLAAFVVSLICSLGGISGAFLLLPFQMSFLNYTAPSVSATNQFYNVVAIPSGVWRFVREGRMLWPLALTVAVGTLPGVFLGAIIRIVWLPDARLFKLFAAVVLVYIGLKLMRSHSGKKKTASTKKQGSLSVRTEEFSLQRLAYVFEGERYVCSTPALAGLSFLIGIVGGTYGIGGGAILSPFLVGLFRLPVHTTAGATLFGTFLTSVAGVIFYTLLAVLFPDKSVSPDWLLGLLFGIGGMAGMYCGARLQRFVPANYIRILLVLILAGTSANFIIDFFR